MRQKKPKIPASLLVMEWKRKLLHKGIWGAVVTSITRLIITKQYLLNSTVKPKLFSMAQPTSSFKRFTCLPSSHLVPSLILFLPWHEPRVPVMLSCVLCLGCPLYLPFLLILSLSMHTSPVLGRVSILHLSFPLEKLPWSTLSNPLGFHSSCGRCC